MGLFKKLFKRDEVDKDFLTRNLIRFRLTNYPDPMTISIRSNEHFINNFVDSLSHVELACFPEGTIVAIVETWSILRKSGVDDDEIFSKIENHRSMEFPRGTLPRPLNLLNYIKYRIELELPDDAAPIHEEFIENAVDIARKAYGDR